MKNTTASPSFEKCWEGNALYGVYDRFFSVGNVAVTAATTACGGVTGVKVARLAVPSVTTPVGGLVWRANMLFQTSQNLAGLEYLLGTLTVSGNSFSAGVTMPTKTVRGESVQTNANICIMHVSTALTATTPVVTLTYTNQAGTGSRTATLTLPTNAGAGSCFLVHPHFQADDLAIYALTGASISTGSAGVLEIFGILPFSKGVTVGVNSYSTDFLSSLEVPYLGVSGENIGFYRLGTGGAAENIIHLQGIPEA